MSIIASLRGERTDRREVRSTKQSHEEHRNTSQILFNPLKIQKIRV